MRRGPPCLTLPIRATLLIVLALPLAPLAAWILDDAFRFPTRALMLEEVIAEPSAVRLSERLEERLRTGPLATGNATTLSRTG